MKSNDGHLGLDWIRKNISEKKCSRYCAVDQNREICQCGREIAKHYAQTGEVRGIHVPTTVFGSATLESNGDSKKLQYVRVADDTSPDLLFTVLTSVWRLNSPKLVVSLLSGSSILNIDADTADVIQSVLGKILQIADTWFIVGEEDEHTMAAQMLNASSSANMWSERISSGVIIGFRSWRGIARRKRKDFRLAMKLIEADAASLLDLAAYTHLFLSDNGTKFPDTERSLKTNFERFLLGTDHQVCAMPLARILIGGSVVAANELHRGLSDEPRLPVLVLAYSGGFSELLACVAKKKIDLRSMPKFQRRLELAILAKGRILDIFGQLPSEQASIIAFRTIDCVENWENYILINDDANSFHDDLFQVLAMSCNQNKTCGATSRHLQDTVKYYRLKLSIMFDEFESDSCFDSQKIGMNSLNPDSLFYKFLSPQERRQAKDEEFLKPSVPYEIIWKLVDQDYYSDAENSLTVTQKLMFWALLNGHQEIVKYLWSVSVHDCLATGIVLSALYKSMGKLRWFSTDTRKELKRNRNETIQLCLRLLICYHHHNERHAQRLLMRPHSLWDNRSIIQLARRFKFREIIAHECVQDIFNQLWKGKNVTAILAEDEEVNHRTWMELVSKNITRQAFEKYNRRDEDIDRDSCSNALSRELEEMNVNMDLTRRQHEKSTNEVLQKVAGDEEYHCGENKWTPAKAGDPTQAKESSNVNKSTRSLMTRRQKLSGILSSLNRISSAPSALANNHSNNINDSNVIRVNAHGTQNDPTVWQSTCRVEPNQTGLNLFAPESINCDHFVVVDKGKPLIESFGLKSKELARTLEGDTLGNNNFTTKKTRRQLSAGKKYSNWNRFTKFFKFLFVVPKGKFTMFAFIYLVFIGMFSHFVLVSHERDGWEEWLLLSIVVALSCDEIQQVVSIDRRSCWKRFTYYIQEYWNILDLIAVLLFYVGFALRFHGGTRIPGMVVLSVDVTLWYFKLFQFYRMSSVLGPYIVMVWRMVRHLLSFLLVLLVAITAYGVFQRALLFMEMNSGPEIVFQLFFKPFLLTFGETNAKESLVANITVFDTRKRSEAIEITVALGFCVYMFVTNLLLINLLVAIFNNIYEDVKNNSDMIWKFERSQMILEFLHKPALPIPLSTINFVSQLLRWWKARNKAISAGRSAENGERMNFSANITRKLVKKEVALTKLFMTELKRKEFIDGPDKIKTLDIDVQKGVNDFRHIVHEFSRESDRLRSKSYQVMGNLLRRELKDMLSRIEAKVEAAGSRSKARI